MKTGSFRSHDLEEGVASAFRVFWLSLTIAYVALLPSFYLVFNESNRRTLLWTRGYHASILTAILLLGLLYFLVYSMWQRMVRLWPKTFRFGVAMATWFMLVVALRTFVSIMDRGQHLPPSVQTLLDDKMSKLIYYVVIPAPLIALFTTRIHRWATRFYMWISPMAVLLVFWPLSYHTYDSRNEPFWSLDSPEASSEGSAAANIYIFILDEWSYARTFQEGTVWNEMPHLRELANIANVYHQAYSPGAHTLTSIPRFLFQEDEGIRSLSHSNLQEWIESPNILDRKSIFTDTPQGWQRYVLGFWHDYDGLIGAHTDYAAYVRNESALRTYGGEVRKLLSTQLGWLRHFGLPEPGEPLPPCALWIYSQKEIHRLAIEIMDRARAPVFAVFHYCFPHYPYIWDANGEKGWIPADIEKHTISNYLDNLRYTDRLIGEIVQALRRADKFDGALLIITSDHSWRHDPEVPGYDPVREDPDAVSRWKHVPLFVKRPYQREGSQVFDTVFTAELYPEIQSVWQAFNEIGSEKNAN